jgi:TonB family protein
MKKIIASLFAAFILTFLFATAINAQTGNSKEYGENQKSDQQNKKLKIKSKPIPRLGGGCSQNSGIVTVVVTFDKSAKITKAEISRSSGCDSFDRRAIQAAMKIKFEPELKDGEPVTVSKPVQYSFRRY